MKKRNSKKGFTLVELVIVIAVIAILAGVLIPTFGGVVEKANQNAAMQEARNIYTEYLAETAGTGKVESDLWVFVDGSETTDKTDDKYVQISGGVVNAQTENVYIVKTAPTAGSKVLTKTVAADGKVTYKVETVPQAQ